MDRFMNIHRQLRKARHINQVDAMGLLASIAHSTRAPRPRSTHLATSALVTGPPLNRRACRSSRSSNENTAPHESPRHSASSESIQSP